MHLCILHWQRDSSDWLCLINRIAGEWWYQSESYPGSFLQFGHHDDVCAPLLPDHPPELAEGLGQRALSGDVSVLLPVAVDVVCVDVVAAWNTCQTQQNTRIMRNWVFSMLLFGRGEKSTKIFYSSKSTITLLKFYLSTSKSTSLKIYSSKSKK